MYRIKQVTEQFGISRSSLLYYDKIGLLSPSARTSANYRLYSQADVDKLGKIMAYRQAGLSLEDIAELLTSSNSATANILEQRLVQLNQDISGLRQQQQQLVSLLENESLLPSTKVMNKDQWVAILAASGMDENDMYQWHIQFEKDRPEVHQDFLKSLGIEAEEIASIRAWSRGKK